MKSQNNFLYDVICVGSASLDIFLESQHFKAAKTKHCFLIDGRSCLEFDRKIEINNVIWQSGGGATNCGVGFARFGFKTAILTKIGRDFVGRQILAELRKEKGLELSLIKKSKKAKSGLSVILLAPTGQKTIMVFRGAVPRFSNKEIDCWRKLQAQWFMITSMGGNLKLIRRIIRWAKNHQSYVAFNPGSAELERKKRLLPLLKRTDVLFLNFKEGKALTGGKDAKETARKLFKLGPKVVVLTLGRKGALAFDGKKMYQVNTKDVKVVDATGAGDAFSTGFLAKFIKTGNIVDALKVGSANAHSVIQHFGAKTGLKYKMETKDFKTKEVK